MRHFTYSKGPILAALVFLFFSGCGQSPSGGSSTVQDGTPVTNPNYGQGNVPANIASDLQNPASIANTNNPLNKIDGQNTGLPVTGSAPSTTSTGSFGDFTDAMDKNGQTPLQMPAGWKNANLISDIMSQVAYVDPRNIKYFPNQAVLLYFQQYYCSALATLGAIPTQDTAAAYLDALFLDNLGRLPDIGAYVKRMRQMNYDPVPMSNRQAVVKGIIESRESFRRMVDSHYQNALDRTQNGFEGKGHVDAYMAGKSVEDTLATFYGSQEAWVRKGKRNPTAWVQYLYRRLLSRDGAPAELRYWARRRSAYSPTNRLQTVKDIVGSEEGTRKSIEYLYAHYLGRPADLEGLLNWTSTITSGALKRLDVLEAFLESDEYLNNSAIRRFGALNVASACNK